MSKAYKQDQVNKFSKVIRDNSYDKLMSEPLAYKVYEAGGRIMPMWVRVFHATEYSWWWVHILTLAGAFYYATFAKEEFEANPWSLIAIPVILFVLIAPFVKSYNELKSEIRMSKPAKKQSAEYRDQYIS